MSTPATTPLLRPISARPQTAASSLHPEGHSIVALLEGRSISHEIGMATLNVEPQNRQNDNCSGEHLPRVPSDRTGTKPTHPTRNSAFGLAHICQNVASNAYPLPVSRPRP